MFENLKNFKRFFFKRRLPLRRPPRLEGKVAQKGIRPVRKKAKRK